MNLVEKYEPKTVSDIIGNNEQIRSLTEIYKKDCYRTTMIIGSNGIGKSTAIKLILKELNIKCKIYDTLLTSNDSLLSELVNLNHNNIVNIMKNNDKKKVVALLVDNFDHINLTSEKQQVYSIITYNIKYKKFPLILISSTYNEKELGVFGEDLLKIKFSYINNQSLLDYLKRIVTLENLEVDDTALSTLVNLCQNDVRRLLYLLQDLVQTFPNTCINNITIEQYIESVDKKSVELNIFESIKEILCSSKNISKVISLYNNEKVLLPLVLQENFFKDVFEKNPKNKLRTIAEVSELISQGDLIETNIYTDQNWLLQDTHCFFSLYKPIKILGDIKTYKSPTEIRYPINFSSELNKTSLKNINRKNISNVNLVFHTNTQNILAMSYILNKLNNSKRHNEIVSLFADYKIDDVWKIVETILKIDKCNKESSVLNSKIRKKF